MRGKVMRVRVLEERVYTVPARLVPVARAALRGKDAEALDELIGDMDDHAVACDVRTLEAREVVGSRKGSGTRVAAALRASLAVLAKASGRQPPQCPQCAGALYVDEHALKGWPLRRHQVLSAARVVCCSACEFVREF